MAASWAGVAMLNERASRNWSSSISLADRFGEDGLSDVLWGAGLGDRERMRSARSARICRCRRCSLDVARSSRGLDIRGEKGKDGVD